MEDYVLGGPQVGTSTPATASFFELGVPYTSQDIMNTTAAMAHTSQGTRP